MALAKHCTREKHQKRGKMERKTAVWIFQTTNLLNPAREDKKYG